MKTESNAGQLLYHLRSEESPFILKRKAQGPQWSDRSLHEAAYAMSPEVYALCGLAEKVQPAQQTRVLYQLLRSSRAGCADETRRLLQRVSQILMLSLPVDEVLQVFLSLKRTRANHKHTTRAMASFLLNHPCLEDLATSRRPALRDCLEHALGRNVARACAKMLDEGKTTDRYLRRNLWRYCSDQKRVGQMLRYVFHKRGVLYTERQAYAHNHKAFALKQVAQEEAYPKTITATNRGDIAATLYHIYRGGATAQLLEGLQEYVDEAAAQLPRFDGSVALLLDASTSTRGFGEREYCCISQSMAFQKVMEACCQELRTYTIGDNQELAAPSGGTDLALALIDALAQEPELVVIVTDGYENQSDGDLERLLLSLPGAGVTTPIALCYSKFTYKDDMSLRQPTQLLPHFSFWHQNDFRDLMLSLFSLAQDKGQDVLQRQLMLRLTSLEKDAPPWISNGSSPSR